jgi:DNA-binding MarR family transcriptional regulator
MTQTRWLDDEEQSAWRAIIDGYLHLLREVERPVQDATGLNSADYAMLVHLSETPQRRARMSELATCSGLPSGQVTYRVDRLVKLGFLERRPSATDRRGSEAVLTEYGFEAFSAAAAIHVEAVRRAFLDHVTRDELRLLGTVMKKMIEHNDGGLD